MKLKKVYDEAKAAYLTYLTDKLWIDKADKHLSRLFRYAIELKRMDFVSKSCLNPIFGDVLRKNGYEKSQQFMEEVKAAWRDGKIWLDEGQIVFAEEIK
jgi:hypothetical protein